MKSFAIACSLLLFAASASAADMAVSSSALGSMGLASMERMSDVDGMTVRGKGTTASVWGNSEASFGGQYSFNAYEAGAQWLGKSSIASGGSLSYAVEMEVLFAADPTGFALQVHAIGGISGGGAHAAAF